MNFKKNTTYAMMALAGVLGIGYLAYDYKKTQKEIIQFEADLKQFQEVQALKKEKQTIFLDPKDSSFNKTLNISFTGTRQIHCICVTGGPGCGKTSVVTFLQERLKDFQYNVIVVPLLDDFILGQDQEIMQELGNEERNQMIIKKMMLMQTLLDYSKDLAQQVKDKDSIILCQGGILDLLSVLDEKEKAKMFEDLEEQFKPLATLRDKNYDAVIHLVTNAEGLQQNFYFGNSFINRDQEINKAIEADRRIQTLWMGHQNHFLIDNRGLTFDKKIQRAYKTVQKILGMVQTNIRWTKIGLKQINFPSDLPRTQIKITDIFLLDEKSQAQKEINRVRMRQVEGGIKQYYLITTKKSQQKDDIQFLRRMISFSQFHHIVNQNQNKIKILERLRYCFTFQNQQLYLINYQE
ncbi:unnamed protein product (macronuclear) [Paramecium tetraurelia]|uniref:NadR/Ttd14 AAA domain-containing protein n=1 Tax=Paramecium tetraurelia TaxID=5888 RepID=A0BIS7_PARTE|nr:uncharacterized protein GSPATT00004816001 [Paramecium tetraurelia]CAK58444.1 unnamed protein product [Paramecium tetraurelia]|eukprot:XP_001425842.1 hypothetical protein (macronuclear) [Paramecium tetraurelia strain d4-2]